MRTYLEILDQEGEEDRIWWIRFFCLPEFPERHRYEIDPAAHFLSCPMKKFRQGVPGRILFRNRGACTR
jgi:hypothetical protein